MYLMYVDESGDPGLQNTPTRYFALSGLVVHETRWREFVNAIIEFRRRLKSIYDLPLRYEIHASEYINKQIRDIKRNDRLAIVRHFLDEIGQFPYVSVTNIIVDKQGRSPDYDVFTNAWRTLFQRFENTLNYANFPEGYENNYGLIFTDNTDGEKLTRIMRKMNAYNPVPNAGSIGYRNMPVIKVIEDPSAKDSMESYLIQAADVCAFALYQKHAPNSYIRRKGARNYFDRLNGVLNNRAARHDSQGIVRL